MANTTFALEIPLIIKDNYPKILKDFWSIEESDNPTSLFVKAQERAIKDNIKYVSFYLNIEKEEEIPYCTETIKEIVKISKTELIIRGCGQKNIDAKLLPQVIPHLTKPCIIGCVQEANYKEILRLKGEHTFVLRTPIDINLTKELNILATDEGLLPNKILIDPDMGCVGYGLDYGYSIIERIKLAAGENDKMLDMPIIVFAGEESYRAKETKSDDFKPSWGELETRAISWEISTVQSLLCAGANMAVIWHPDTIKTLREIQNA